MIHAVVCRFCSAGACRCTVMLLQAVPRALCWYYALTDLPSQTHVPPQSAGVRACGRARHRARCMQELVDEGKYVEGEQGWARSDLDAEEVDAAEKATAYYRCARRRLAPSCPCTTFFPL